MKKKCERTSRKEGQGSASKVLCTRPAPDEAGEKKKTVSGRVQVRRKAVSER